MYLDIFEGTLVLPEVSKTRVRVGLALSISVKVSDRYLFP
jgi:hypothetical protein